MTEREILEKLIKAGEEAKRKLEQFNSPLHYMTEKYGGINVYLKGHPTYIEENTDGIFVVIPLPNANSMWTFAAWELAKKICNESGGYPYHCAGREYKPANNIYVRLRGSA